MQGIKYYQHKKVVFWSQSGKDDKSDKEGQQCSLKKKKTHSHRYSW